VLLHDRFPDQARSVNLSGFIAPSPDSTIRLSPSPSSLDEYIDIPESAVLHAEQDESGVAELFIDPAAELRIVSVRRHSLPALARLINQSDGEEPAKSCVDKRIEKCKTDPMVGNKSFCESAQGRRTFQLLCDLFGDPKFQSTGGGGGVFI
jgi:hypothetical protein